MTTEEYGLGELRFKIETFIAYLFYNMKENNFKHIMEKYLVLIVLL